MAEKFFLQPKKFSSFVSSFLLQKCRYLHRYGLSFPNQILIFFNAMFFLFVFFVLIFLVNRSPGLCSTWMTRLWSDRLTEKKKDMYSCVHIDKTDNQATGWDQCSNRGGGSPKFLLLCQERKIHQNILYWPLVMGQEVRTRGWSHRLVHALAKGIKKAKALAITEERKAYSGATQAGESEEIHKIRNRWRVCCAQNTRQSSCTCWLMSVGSETTQKNYSSQLKVK